MNQTEFPNFEDSLRAVLHADDEGAPGFAPAALVRAGRRRRHARLAGASAVVVAGAVAVTMPLMPGGSPRHTVVAAPAAGTTGTGTAGMGSARLEGVSASAALRAFDGCVAEQEPMQNGGATKQTGRVTGIDSDASHFQVLLATKIGANKNEGGPGIGVVGIDTAKPGSSLFCADRSGTLYFRDFGETAIGSPDAAVRLDANVSTLYRVMPGMSAPGAADPFRWIDFARISSKTAKVTVSYGGTTVTARLVDGYFVADGTLTAPSVRAPVVRAYAANGSVLYDSTKDHSYQQVN